jgi:hypothetical protein
LYGSVLGVGYETGPDERDPAIACNSDDHTCLVVYENNEPGNGDIYGQRVAVGSSNISRDGDRFNVHVVSADQYNPDVAWGGNDDNYLVVWQQMYTTPSNHYRILFHHVYDTDQGAGSETQHSATRLISLGEWERSQTMPSVAYNRYDQRYLVAFQYDYWGNGSDYDVAARRVGGTGAIVTGDPFYVATSSDDETSPAVAFSGGTQSLPGGMGANQYLVTYVRDRSASSVVYGQAVKGAYATSGGQLDGDPAAVRTTLAGSNFGVFDPDVTGSINNGRYMVVWEDMIGGVAGNDYDVLGRLVAPYAVYLPLVLRNH